MIVIATERAYIVSNKIHSMYVEETLEEKDKPNGKGIIQVPVTVIHVRFEPYTAAQAAGTRSEDYGVEIRVFSRKKAIELFKDMVRQVREQSPDLVYLNEIAEKFLAGVIADDTSADEICGVRKEERRSKKVLPRAGKRSRRTKK